MTKVSSYKQKENNKIRYHGTAGKNKAHSKQNYW